MNDLRHIHLIGIGGAGLSAIATVLLARGVRVSGSDRQDGPALQRLRELGAHITLGHAAGALQGADLVLRSSAVNADNPEVQAAQAAGIPVLRREQFLPQLIGEQQAIAVAGTHGKTTTTAMIAWVLTSLGQDPSYVIGGAAYNLAANAHAGQGTHFVIEADEYDRMFLGLQPALAVVTNVEHDHPDYYPTGDDYRAAFGQFLRQVRSDGVRVVCADDPGAAALLAADRAACLAAGAACLALTYGLSAEADVRAVALEALPGGGTRFDVTRQGILLLPAVTLQVSGEHNVRNALAALTCAALLGLPLAQAAQALHSFRGTGRRFDVLGTFSGITLVDDYAHHPTEIRATLAAAQAQFQGRRIWAVWQPHTWSRLRTLLADFVAAFDQADVVLVTDVYPARETAPADGFSSLAVVQGLAQRRPDLPLYGPYDLAQARNWLGTALQPGDVVLVLSAGDAGGSDGQLTAALQPLLALAAQPDQQEAHQ